MEKFIRFFMRHIALCASLLFLFFSIFIGWKFQTWLQVNLQISFFNFMSIIGAITAISWTGLRYIQTEKLLAHNQEQLITNRLSTLFLAVINMVEENQNKTHPSSPANFINAMQTILQHEYGNDKKILARKQTEFFNFGYMKLEKIDLRGGNLRGSNLKGANLNYAILRGTILSDAILRGAKLQYADLKGANLSNTDLSWINFKGSDISHAIFEGANFWEAKIDITYKDLLATQYLKNFDSIIWLETNSKSQ